MISTNLVLAVVTVVLRGFLDRVFGGTTVVKTSFLPQSTTIVLISGILHLLYNYLINGKRIKINYSSPSSKKSKILDGRLHKNDPQLSRVPRKFRSSRSRNNLLQATKDSLQLLQGECSSIHSLSSDHVSSLKCEDGSSERMTTKESSPSQYSTKSEGESLKEESYGDGEWAENRPKSIRKRRFRNIRKTRSGRIY